jgi:Xaa-Pro aminopeptidase
VWDIVFEAQTQSIHRMKENLTAASVDIAARNVITAAGYGEAFTHRVGHGIGIKGMDLYRIHNLIRKSSNLANSPRKSISQQRQYQYSAQNRHDIHFRAWYLLGG